MFFSFKQHCLICRQSSKDSICYTCKQDLQLFVLNQYQHNLMLWPKVQKGLPKVNFENVLALADYQWPISKLLTGLKFSAYLPNAHALAELFVNHCIDEDNCKPQVIIPMPLHKNRYLFRTFNQSIELAKHISHFSNIKLDCSILTRKKPTHAQTKLNAAQRRKNLRNAFQVSPSSQNKLNQYQHIALFDDVVTTGTTMNAAYNKLILSQPNLRIDIWAICLTLAHR